MTKVTGVDAKRELIEMGRARHASELSRYDAYDRHGERKSRATIIGNGSRQYDRNILYTEGCIVGREQIDPSTDALDETADVLNPYRAAEEREPWALGFKDAVNHAVKYIRQY